MSERWPRLSQTLPGPHAPDSCARCQADHDLVRWQEHDDLDRPETIVVVLCDACSKAIIEKHPRLYGRLHLWEPFPGSMPLCVACTHRAGTRCTHPDLKANGGPGLVLTFPPPMHALVDGVRGGRRTGWRETIWRGPVETCAGMGDLAPKNPTETL